LGKTVDFEELSKDFKNNFTGADFYALCSDALMKAIMRMAEELEIELKSKNESKKENIQMNTYLNDKDVKVIVEQKDFRLALDNLNPSVSEKDLKHYEQLQKKYKN
jgi:peroxin-6